MNALSRPPRSLLLLLLPWLSACSLLPAPQPVEILAYDLGLPPAAVAAAGARGPVLAVASPRFHPGLLGQGLAYRRQAQQLAYFARHRWVAPPAELLEQALPAALGGVPGVAAVIDERSSGRADWRLETHWHHFEQDFSVRPSRARIQLEARVVDLDSGRLLGQRLLGAEVPAASDDPEGGVRALRQGLGEVVVGLRRLVAEAAAGGRQ